MSEYLLFTETVWWIVGRALLLTGCRRSFLFLLLLKARLDITQVTLHLTRSALTYSNIISTAAEWNEY